MTDRSEPGFFLSGQPMPPPGPARRRPFGHAAVLVYSASGARIEYVPDAAHEALDKARSR